MCVYLISEMVSLGYSKEDETSELEESWLELVYYIGTHE